MRKKHFAQLLEAIERLEERGVIGKDASNDLRNQERVLQRAIATKNHKLVKQTVAKISQILNGELAR